jgi:glutamate synthase (ferredoxin)
MAVDVNQRLAEIAPLYNPLFEHDACGVGLVVDIHGRPSRDIVTRALAGLVNLTHRGGVGADERTGDGAGLLTQIPVALLAPDLAPGQLGVAMLFVPRDVDLAATSRDLLAQAMTDRGLLVRGWRETPIDASVLGRIASQTQPGIAQLLIQRPDGLSEDDFERELMLARKAAERATAAAEISDFFVVSCSCRTIIYKGFCLPEDLAAFYLDLQDPAFTSAIALFHQRYSTNTLPTWAMSQPFRFIAHNGEINTIQGNRLWMQARTPVLEYPGVATVDELQPLVSLTGSDSLSLDNVIELLYHGGRSLPHALMMLVPEAWERFKDMDPGRRAFYDYHAGLNEQWDGPAALAFSDGILAGATLDRNGLRPLRYAITSDGLLIAGSEAGTVAVDQSTVIEKGRLGPGQMIVVDTRRGVVLRNPDIKAEVAGRKPYQEWLDRQRVCIDRDGSAPATTPVENLTAVQSSFGYSSEDGRLIVQPMASESKEPTWSMGDDAPLAVLSDRPRPLSAYFRQRFAQVTNPPIDSLRERSVLS